MSSTHISNFRLNTWSHTPYFEAHAPAGLNITMATVQAQAYLNLPPGIRSLCEASRTWAEANGWTIQGYADAYDSEGRELDPSTGRPEPRADALAQVGDIDIPAGGWPNPATWQPAREAPEADDGIDQIPVEQILADVASHGVERTADEYGLSVATVRRLLR